jgi:hypothetical protein
LMSRKSKVFYKETDPFYKKQRGHILAQSIAVGPRPQSSHIKKQRPLSTSINRNQQKQKQCTQEGSMTSLT